MIRARWRLAAACAAAALTASCSVQASGIGRIVPQLPERSESPGLPPAPTTPPEKPRLVEAPTETHEGTGNATVPVSWPADVAGFMKFDCPKCSSNVAVHTDGSEGLPVNAIGSYHGTSWLNVSPIDEPVHTLEIETNAAWTVTITDYRGVPTVETGKPYSAHGDGVVRIPAGVTHAKFATKTRGNSALWTLSKGHQELPVNKIGNYEGDVPINGETYVKVDAYDANWTLTTS
ncbi:hypothetical protein [Amycolatopsis benzoatilytica]|uniref:hypothetical protein n=1 Tax=Amycolatopsis benzoatilytica TaxID=346045 RepID=UPI00036CB54D|nr:hypothetical protein [Amycolatopsis benzoatilytica]